MESITKDCTKEKGDLAKIQVPIAHWSSACDKTCFPWFHLILGSFIVSGMLTACAARVSTKLSERWAILVRFLERLSGSSFIVPVNTLKTLRSMNISKICTPGAWGGAIASRPYPSKATKKGLLPRKFITDDAGFFHSPPPVTARQLPPERKCLRTSCSANWTAISRLGAKWFDRIEQNRKIALKHSKVSVATPRRGPNRMISWRKWARRWYFIFRITLLGSIREAISRTLAAAVSTSALIE